MNNWLVYCYTGKNNKKYVGITGRTIAARAGNNGINYVHDNYAFGNAILKHGFDFFTVETLETNLTFEEACEKEKYYIQLYDSYNNGYNCTLGGDGVPRADYELISTLWDNGSNINEIKVATGYGERAIHNALSQKGISGSERIKRSAGQYHSYPVYQYTLQGEYIQGFNSIAEAQQKTGVPNSNITKVVNGTRNCAGGFIWSKSKQDKIEPPKKKKGNKKTVYQYNLQNELVAQYESTAEVERLLEYGKEYIAKNAREKTIAYGYRWSYEKLNND